MRRAFLIFLYIINGQSHSPLREGGVYVIFLNVRGIDVISFDHADVFVILKNIRGISVILWTDKLFMTVVLASGHISM